MIEDVKEQHAFAIQRGDWRDAAQMQSLILAMLTAVRGGIDGSLVNEYKERSADVFLRLAENARANRLQTSLLYGKFEAKLRNRER